jgi:hypothetical protein
MRLIFDVRRRQPVRILKMRRECDTIGQLGQIVADGEDAETAPEMATEPSVVLPPHGARTPLSWPSASRRGCRPERRFENPLDSIRAAIALAVRYVGPTTASRPVNKTGSASASNPSGRREGARRQQLWCRHAEFSKVMSGRRDNIFHERDVGERWRELFSGLSSEPGTPSLRR